jgi:3-oxoacyl-[acyl-carrier protein] reductase
MDLGIAGRWALVCAASKGLGKGCAQALVLEGVNVVVTARGREALEATAAELRALAPGVEVRAVAGDIATAEGRAAALAAAPQVDILVNNAGGPPAGDFRDWDRETWIRALDANMLAPIELMKATVDAMAERGFGRVVNITSGAVKAPIDNLLPGPFDTDRLRANTTAVAQRSGKSFDSIWEQRRLSNPTQRYGTAAEFGAACAFLCSAHAGYMTGQNVLIDGGYYPGTF